MIPENQRKPTFLIGQNMIKALEQLHTIGLLCGGVTPQTFRITPDHRVLLSNLKQVSEYMINGNHKSMGRYGFMGIPYFASMN